MQMQLFMGHSELAVVVHASRAPAFAGSCLGQKKIRVGGSKGVLPALAGTREYKQSDRNW